MTAENIPPAAETLSAADERTWSALAHFGGLLSFFGPLIVWLIYRDRSAAVTREAKESLNFQLTIALAALALSVVGSVLALVVVGLLFLALVPIVLLFGLVFAIVGGVRTQRTGSYRYPFAIRFVR